MRVSDLHIDRIYTSILSRPSTFRMPETHIHYYFEFFYVRQGSCRFFIQNSLYDLHAGEFLIIPPDLSHFNRYLSNCTRITIYFRQSDIEDNGNPYLEGYDLRFLQLCKVHIPSAFRDVFERIFDEMLAEEKVDNQATPMMTRLLFRQLLIYADRYGVFQYEDSIAPAMEGNEGILAAAKYITEHYAAPITLESMARLANLSPSYFSRRFHQVTGNSMKEYLTFTRLQHASMELLTTNHTITEVAANCGFSGSNYFKDAFRREFGMSPRAYRASKTTDQVLAQSIIAREAESKGRDN